MGCASSKEIDNSYALHPTLLEEHVYQLNLPVPPTNGFDSFLTLQWCRDLQEEQDELAQAEKAAAKANRKKNKKGSNAPAAEGLRPQGGCLRAFGIAGEAETIIMGNDGLRSFSTAC